MQMSRQCNFGLRFGMKLFLCFIPTQEIFVVLVRTSEKKNRKTLSCMPCFASFILTYVSNLAHISTHIKMQFF